MKKDLFISVVIGVTLLLCFVAFAIALAFSESKILKTNPLTQVANATGTFEAEQSHAQLTCMAMEAMIPPTEFGPTPDKVITDCGPTPQGTWSQVVAPGSYFQYGQVSFHNRGLGIVEIGVVDRLGPWQLVTGETVQPSGFTGICMTLKSDGSVVFEVRSPVETPTPGVTPTLYTPPTMP